MTGVELIAAERTRQIEKNCFTADHDDRHTDGSIALAAVCFAAPTTIYALEFDDQQNEGRLVDPWPPGWAKYWDRRPQRDQETLADSPQGFPDPSTFTLQERIDLLIRSGALVAAEIDRLLRWQKKRAVIMGPQAKEEGCVG